MMDPAGIGPDLRAELHRYFTTEQIVELSLDVSAWNRQKVMVALDTDRPVREDELSALTFDAEGRSEVGRAG